MVREWQISLLAVAAMLTCTRDQMQAHKEFPDDARSNFGYQQEGSKD